MRILGVDPGFASFGFAVLELPAEGDPFAVAAGVIETKKSPKKANVYATEDNVRRMREIARALEKLLEEHRPVVICAESQSFPRNASTTAKMGMAWGVLSTIAGGIPIVQVSPQALKKAIAGARDASKEAVELCVRVELGGIEELLEKLAKGKREHPYDAAACALACLDSELVRSVRLFASRA